MDFNKMNDSLQAVKGLCQQAQGIIDEQLDKIVDEEYGINSSTDKNYEMGISLLHEAYFSMLEYLEEAESYLDYVCQIDK